MNTISETSLSFGVHGYGDLHKKKGGGLVIGFVYNKLFNKCITFSSIHGSLFVIMARYITLM